MNKKFKKVLTDCLFEVLGSILIAAGTYNVALSASFPLTGFSGIAMVIYRLFGVKMGLTIILMNIPLAIFCFRKIGKGFMIKTLRCMVISTFFLDYVAPLFPVYQGDRLIAALLTGVLCGAGYAMIYIRASSTGGMDLVMVLIKSVVPHVKTGTITMGCDFFIVVGTGIIFKDFDGIVYGLIIDFLMATVLDKVILGLNSGNVAFIVTTHPEMTCRIVDEVCERGATILKAKGGYRGDDKSVVMVAGSNKDIYQINHAIAQADPKAFTIIMDSKEVHGEGFHITRMVGEV